MPIKGPSPQPFENAHDPLAFMHEISPSRTYYPWLSLKRKCTNTGQIQSIFFSESRAACKLELDDTLSKKRCEYAINTRKRRNIERGLTDKNYPHSLWKPKGILVAHLHEHQVLT